MSAIQAVGIIAAADGQCTPDRTTAVSTPIGVERGSGGTIARFGRSCPNLTRQLMTETETAAERGNTLLFSLDNCEPMTGLYHEEFSVGETIEHDRRRTISESDSQRFCGLTIPETTDGTIVANLSHDDVEHPTPVFDGDTICSQSTVTDKPETSDGEHGIVTMHVEVFTARATGRGSRAEGESGGEEPLVCSFDRTVLSLKRDRGTGSSGSETATDTEEGQ